MLRQLKLILKENVDVLYTRYPIVARRAWPVQPLGRVRRASKGILHTSGRPEGVEALRTFADRGWGLKWPKICGRPLWKTNNEYGQGT